MIKTLFGNSFALLIWNHLFGLLQTSLASRIARVKNGVFFHVSVDPAVLRTVKEDYLNTSVTLRIFALSLAPFLSTLVLDESCMRGIVDFILSSVELTYIC